jgi:hypothetical protein
MLIFFKLERMENFILENFIFSVLPMSRLLVRLDWKNYKIQELSKKHNIFKILVFVTMKFGWIRDPMVPTSGESANIDPISRPREKDRPNLFHENQRHHSKEYLLQSSSTIYIIGMETQ